MHKTIKIGKIKTSKIELIDIAKAWIAISIAFAFVLGGFSLIEGNILGILSLQFGKIFVISLFTAGLGFLLHELGHKFVAQKYGCVAEFRAFDQMLYLAVGLAVVIGFIFAAPGAVMISGMITRKENGIISLAGPMVNYTLALIFLGMQFLYPAMNFISSIGFFINMWLGLFNLIPFGNFDGKKILSWNRYVWSGMVIFGVYFLFFY
ncbi:MAG: metalloprotease [Nanoarchaeota archaeon]|nr:metalloprotease [Nanoarchaeota archaeon]MBU1632077.1 metalloprotease [Nanoarchaeota archaeon]MBU1875711.1 metalloprotease [Nanoarchaeota archaeon]